MSSEDTKAVKEEVSTKEEDVKGAAASDEKEEVVVEKKEVSIYDEAMPNRIIVGRNSPLSFYMDRARRVFRCDTEVTVSGRGDNISTACKLVESLKSQKIAKIEKISTGMSVEPYFTNRGDAKWGPPSAVISFKLSRGEFGEFIADYQQRKVVEIFEKTDESKEGVLSVDKVESLALGTAFKANDEQIEKSKKFLSGAGKTMDLPTFIKYASILIHPLLKNKVFKDVLSDTFKIAVSGKVSSDKTDEKEEVIDID